MPMAEPSPTQNVRIRCIMHRGDINEGTFVELAAGERIINIDHEGMLCYVYVVADV
jgi:hypothetical protein